VSSKTFRQRVRHAIQLYPVTAGALVALAVAAVALVLVLDEQSHGRDRDERLARTDVQIRNALAQIRSTRINGVRLTCKLNKRQNTVLLALIDLSIQQRKREGRYVDPRVLSQTNRLLAPITPERTRRVCQALLRGAQNNPPPPP
jgi:hypothetical protein